MGWWWSFVSRTDHSSDSILCTVTEVVVSTFLPRGLAKSEQKCWVMETLLGAVSEWGVPGIDTGCFGDRGSAGSENVENFKVKRGSFLFFLSDLNKNSQCRIWIISSSSIGYHFSFSISLSGELLEFLEQCRGHKEELVRLPWCSSGSDSVLPNAGGYGFHPWLVNQDPTHHGAQPKIK